ncbi:MAG: DUF1206 domain-containing protein [Chloroflexi bacterium]|nr:MAG: DUF1206 domain-containing protein [Chloroflexota bacterium]
MASAHHVARRAKSATRRGISNPWLEFLERAGYVVRGVLYAAMGTFALGLALGLGGTATDQSGSLVILTGGPAGKVLLFAVVIGLGAYSIWGFVRAVFDPLQRGDGASGIAERLGFVWSGIAYSAIAIFALHLIAGGAPSSSRDSTQEAIAKVLALPAGQLATVAIGIVAIGVGLAQLIDAYRAIFKKDLKRTKMNQAEKKIVDALGRLGMVARGVTFSVVGWFVLQGGLHRDPAQVHGYGGAFLFLLTQPFGRVLLAAVAVGFIALGLHSFACARWIRLLGSHR